MSKPPTPASDRAPDGAAYTQSQFCREAGCPGGNTDFGNGASAWDTDGNDPGSDGAPIEALLPAHSPAQPQQPALLQPAETIDPDSRLRPMSLSPATFIVKEQNGETLWR
jgi:hypothetical protein